LDNQLKSHNKFDSAGWDSMLSCYFQKKDVYKVSNYGILLCTKYPVMMNIRLSAFFCLCQPYKREAPR